MDDTALKRASEVCSSFEGRPDDLIPILQQLQAEFGYLPHEAMLAAAGALGVPESRVYAVATFYAQFRFTPIGKTHIMVCRGTSCHVRGAPRILEAVERRLGIKEGQTTPDREFSLETVACIGACGLSPCAMVNKKVEASLTPGKVADLLEGTADEHHGD